MSEETAWQIVRSTEDGEYVHYTRLDGVMETMMEMDDTEVLAIGYEDTRSEWEKLMSLPEFGVSGGNTNTSETSEKSTEMDTEILASVDHERAVDAINFDLVAEHFDGETAEEMQRVGTNWDDAFVEERTVFALMVEKLQRMSKRAQWMLESDAWDTSMED